MTWYCPKCLNEHAEDEPFIMIEETQFCIPHAKKTTLYNYATWREPNPPAPPTPSPLYPL